jgi:hypothetical protein
MQNDILQDRQRDTRRLRRQALSMTMIGMVVVYILWNMHELDFLMYPLRLFVTYVHEAGHALAALISGGQVVGFLVAADGSGLATTIGGSRALILPAGYVGAALFGSLLFFIANRFPRYVNHIIAVLGLGIITFTILFARPDETGAPVALVIGIVFGLLLLGIGWKANRLITLLVVNVLGMVTALNAVLDVWYIVQNSDAGRGMVTNDAAAFSRDITPLLPAAVVAFIWAGIAVALMSLALWYGVWKPLRFEIDDAVENIQR